MSKSNCLIYYIRLYDSIAEAQSGAVWKQLVALVEIMEAVEAFGIERTYGSIYHIRVSSEI